MNEENRIWVLFARKLAGEATANDLKEFEILVNENPEWQEAIDDVSEWWNTSKVGVANEETEAIFTRVLQKIRTDEKLKAKEMLLKKEKSKISLSGFLNGNPMFRNYFKIAWRNLVRGGVFSVINITGLAIGMAGAILVMVWIAQQLSFDQFHQKKDRLYQLYNLAENKGEKMAWSGTSSLLGPELKSTYPQVEEMFRINWVANLIFISGEKHLEAQGLFTDPGFLRSLDFPLISGNKDIALNNPESVILTESFSKKLFGDEDPTGKTIKIDSNANFTVTGVIKNPPANTVFKFEYLMPMTYRKKIDWEIAKWDDYGVETYVMLKPGVTEQTANDLFRNVMKRNMPEIKNEIFVHPMRKWYLYSHFQNGVATASNMRGVRLFGIIGAFILLIACINYMNLSTAKSEKRAREVGIRKVVGARKSSLLWQFIGESILMAFVAGMLALIIAETCIGWFGKLTYADLSIPYSKLSCTLSGCSSSYCSIKRRF
jgi:putative ABC transport system permease protein